jgi:hypothetical protein
MKKICWLMFIVTWSNISFAQSNKMRADGGMSFGLITPMQEHKYNSSSVNVLEFAKDGSYFALDAHVGFGSGWKAGIYFNVVSENLSDTAFSDYLLSTLDTAGYFVTREAGKNQYYQSRFYAVQVANDIEFGHWILTPQIGLGLANTNLYFQNTFMLKERGTNYWKKTEISNHEFSGIDLALKPGLKMGYWFDIKSDRCLLYLSVDFVRYKSVVGLDYNTIDVFTSTASNTQWKSGIVSSLSLGAGVTYYIMPDPTVVKNSERTRERANRKRKKEISPAVDESY